MAETQGDAIPRLLVVTRNASLVIGLTFIGRDWEVVASESLDLEHPSDLLVIDTGTTSDGLEVLSGSASSDGRPPAVVIGDEPLPLAEPDQLLLRPFTIEELATRIDQLLLPDQPVTSSMPVPGPDASLWAGQADLPRETDAQERGSPTPARTTLRSWADRLGQRRSGWEAAGPAAAWTEDAIPIPGDEDTAPSDRSASEEPPSSEDIEVVIDLVQQREPLEPHDLSAGLAPDAVGGIEPEPATSARPSERSGAITRVASRFTARDREHGTPEAEMRRRLAEVVTAGSELELLVRDLPLLRSLRGVATSVVEEAHELLHADTAAYFTRRADGFYILASIGLTNVERRLVASLDQPMLAEVDASGGGLLIDPIEAAHAAVAGIGGAHTESFMAASVAAGSGRFGLLVVGRNDPLTERELDKLVALAREAAPGLAVAQLLRRLGALVIDRSDERAPTGQSRGGDLGVRLSVDG